VPAYIDVTTDATGPSNSVCGGPVCCSITRINPYPQQSTWIQTKAPVTGGRQRFTIADQDLPGTFNIILYYGAFQWSDQQNLVSGQTLYMTRKFGAAAGTTGTLPECIPHATKVEGGWNWVCDSAGIWNTTSPVETVSPTTQQTASQAAAPTAVGASTNTQVSQAILNKYNAGLCISDSEVSWALANDPTLWYIVSGNACSKVSPNAATAAAVAPAAAAPAAAVSAAAPATGALTLTSTVLGVPVWAALAVAVVLVVAVALAMKSGE
jgi:hypothetical protein